MVRLVCRQCQAVTSVPDQALSGGDLTQVQCPICHDLMALERHGWSADNRNTDGAPSSWSSRPAGESVHQSEEVTPMHLIEAGGRTALLCVADPALSEKVAQVAKQLDFYVVAAQRTSSALSRLEYDQYDLIVLDEMYGGSEPSKNPVLLYLQSLPMPVRRRSFLCFLSTTTPTLDHMAAFRIGANLILNVQDLERMPVILERMVKDHLIFYALFNDELSQKGVSSVQGKTNRA